MKFSEYIREEREVNLMGMVIGGRTLTVETISKEWSGTFNCDNKKLTSLMGAPTIIDGTFSCPENELTSLEGAPRVVKRGFYCNSNKLTTLKGAPESVGGNFHCNDNKLTSLEFIPKEIGGDLNFADNDITNLKNIHKMITKIESCKFTCYGNPIKSHVLGLLLIPGLKVVKSEWRWSAILNKYIDKGRKGMIDCQNELIEAGFEECAQL